MIEGRDVLLVGPSREAEARLLAIEGFDAATTGSGLRAIARLTRSPSYVTVVSASEFAGRERAAVDALRTAGGRTQILLTVPSAADEPHRPAGDYGADEILVEPYAPDEFASRVRRLVARGRRRAAGTPAIALGARTPAHELLDLLEEVSRLHAAPARPHALAEITLDILAAHTGATRISLLLVNRKRRSLSLCASRGLPDRIAACLAIPMGVGIAGRAAEERSPMVVADVTANGHGLQPGPGHYQTRSFASLPLISGGRLIGVVNLADRADGSAFDPTSLPALALLAGEAARAFENALRLGRMTRLSVVDDRTGLFNSRFLGRSLGREFRRAVRYRRPLTFAIIDIDHFKIFNDNNGHEAGNLALARIGRILKASFRDTDTVARYGGEEFAVILPELEKGADLTSGARFVLERLRQRVRATRFPGEESQPAGTLTVSCGAASFPGDGETAEDLIVRADQAMYEAKRAGRDRVC